MHKSISTPNLSVHNTVVTGLRRNISTNALPDLTPIDAIILTKAPIHQAISCISTSFPNSVLTQNETDTELLNCLVTPCETVDVQERSLISTVNRNYLHLAVENEKTREKYFSWLRKIRKERKNTN